jgi:mono/diheme cytochrome c family protein
MLVFEVGGKQKLPPNAPYTPRQLNPPPLTASADVVARGSQLYEQNCSVCHGANATQQRSSFPNLTVTPFLHSQEAWDTVVLQGQRVDKGMASFSAQLQPADSAAVRAYLISRANELKNNPPPAGGFGGRGGGAGAGGAAAPARAPAPAPQNQDVHQEAAGGTR